MPQNKWVRSGGKGGRLWVRSGGKGGHLFFLTRKEEQQSSSLLGVTDKGGEKGNQILTHRKRQGPQPLHRKLQTQGHKTKATYS